MKTPKASKQSDFFAALIRSGYFPQELPPVITTRTFAQFCKVNYTILKAQQGVLVGKTTNYETFTAPRPNLGRRNLALVHPLAQAGISLLITQHRKKIGKLISKSGTSLYRTGEDLQNSKAFLGLDFRKRDVLRAKTYSEYPFILSADISRFFYTAYTHSIPWAIVGKDKVKEWLSSKQQKKLNAHWSNDFDRALQSCQSRETFGIPVGPDTSRIIAEILLAGVEKDKDLQIFLKDRSAFRLLDDFIIGFEEEGAAAYKALSALRAALWKYNLQLNEEKTFVSPSRALFEQKWTFDHDAVSISDKDVVAQEQDIYRFVDLLISQLFRLLFT